MQTQFSGHHFAFSRKSANTLKRQFEEQNIPAKVMSVDQFRRQPGFKPSDAGKITAFNNRAKAAAPELNTSRDYSATHVVLTRHHADPALKKATRTENKAEALIYAEFLAGEALKVLKKLGSLLDKRARETQPQLPQ